MCLFMRKFISRNIELVKSSQVVETSSVVSFMGLLPAEYRNLPFLPIDLAGSLPNPSLASSRRFSTPTKLCFFGSPSIIHSIGKHLLRFDCMAAPAEMMT